MIEKEEESAQTGANALISLALARWAFFDRCTMIPPTVPGGAPAKPPDDPNPAVNRGHDHHKVITMADIAKAAGVSQGVVQHRPRTHFASLSPMQAMRRKEWLLLWRDPWLVSQTLMQLLYLLPPALLLWKDFSEDGKGMLVIVPVLIMAAGQLAGGVTWITISGEDAPDMVNTCPLSVRHVMLAKLQTVMRAIVMVFAPLVALLAYESPWTGLVSAGGIAAASASSVIIQLWFRTQAKRSTFRRRHAASRIATFAEAFCCVAWASTTVLVAIKTWLAALTLVFAIGVLAVARLLRPKNG